MPARWFRRRPQGLEAPTEYLFVDERRLDSYVEQIAGPVAFDTIPTYKASLSLTGPGVEVSRESRARDFTQHEKIETLLSHLERGDLVKLGRPGETFEPESGFRMETCTAARALLPPAPGSLALWISDQPEQPPSPDAHRPIGRLYLIEDFRGDDLDLADHIAVSGWTALQMLLHDHDENARTAIEDSPLRGVADADFATRPLELIADLDGRIASPRRIRTLYRVRDTFAEEHADFASVTIGYPIFVAAA